MTSGIDDADVSLKVIAVGDAAVGKTSIAGRYVTGSFESSYKATIGTDIFRKIVTVEGLRIALLIYDTAGQERFGPVRKKYYKGARGAVLVFDLANPVSFERLNFWVKEVEQACGDIPMVFVGNKADLRSSVTPDQIQEFASGYKIQYVETSAKTGMNTVKPFLLFIFISPIKSL